MITDFSNGDRIRLYGGTSYRLVSGRYDNNRGVLIDALSTAPANMPEAIGFVQGAPLASLSLTNVNQFLYV